MTPAPDGPHVEQVGWGVARQVARVLLGPGTSDALVVRALHDVATAGIGWLEVDWSGADLAALGFV